VPGGQRFLLLGIVLATGPLAGAEPPPPTFAVGKAASAITVDGALEEAAWAAPPTFTLDYETEPRENVPPEAATEIWLTYDDSRLYAAFRARDPEPRRIQAHLTDRDRAFEDDYVGLVLDTFNDEVRGFEFLVNPLGVQMDLTRTEISGAEDDSWDAIWASAGRLTETGYEVELAIPFSSLRFPPTDGPLTWGLDAVRRRPRDQVQRIALTPRPRGALCYLCAVAKVTGFTGATPGRNLEFDPTLTATGTETRVDSGDEFAQDDDVEPGLTARWGVTPGLILNGALNPDFSQVEADAAQLDVNTQFALFYPEKRPFFLEGADLFETRVNTVYTRDIADPDWGAKVSGKQGPHAFAAVAARDAVTNLLLPGSELSELTSLEDESTAGLLRYRRDLGNSSTVGLLYTDRSATGYANRVLGTDAVLRFGDSNIFRLELFGSQTEYPEDFAAAFGQPAGAFEDHALRLGYRYSVRRGAVGIALWDVGPDYRADLGFVPQVGYRLANPIAELFWYPTEGRWTQTTVGGLGFWNEDADGNELERRVEAWTGAEGPLQSRLFLTVGAGERGFADETFDDNWVAVDLEARPVKPLRIGLEGRVGDQIDFAGARQGSIVEASPEVDLDVGRSLRFELDHDWARLDVAAGQVFDIHLGQLRTTYQWNVRTFVRWITQYQDLHRNPELHADPVEERTRRWFNQLLFSYKLNPQTVFFLGYTDDYRSPLLDEAPPEEVAAADLEQESRALFLKIGYAWVL
jgi:hypothetical protein